jgi:hypothetical protein
MAALLRFVLGLNSDVCVDRAAVVLPVELVVHRTDAGVKEGKRSIDGQLNEGNGCSFDELYLCYPEL